MLYRVRRSLSRQWFRVNARGILDTPVVVRDPASPVTILSQVSHHDVYMYLLAIKSMCRFIRPRQVVVLDDTSLTADDKALLARHIEGLRVHRTVDVTNEKCPRGLCWERLLFMADAVTDGYVIQLDSDTVTLRRPQDAIDCVTSDRSFTLGTTLGQEVVSMEAACAAACARPGATNGHVQAVAEAAFDRLSHCRDSMYVRGCAAFVGYAPGSLSRATVEQFSVEMSAIVGGNKWSEWGSDQIASNYIIANTPAARVLPLARYSCYSPALDVSACAFLHFIGTYRFKRNAYVRTARRVIKALNQYWAVA